ncbi:MAG: endo-1,4-beta-xylanase [Oscillospiraceae bacterium]|nr:endo-1,4-beta-xylanase [Oscillospiraceae bacterium]
MSLHQHYANHFKIGAAVNAYTVDSRAELLREHFNSVTCGNETKPASVTRDGETYDFAQGDKIRDFAAANDMAFRLHTLAWHNQTPPALYSGKSRTDAIAALDRHIARMAAQYPDAYAVDVVNEVISDAPNGDALRKTQLLEIIGVDYLDIAYTAARRHFPNAALVVNDYNECDAVKSRRIFELVRGMRERGVPVDAVGMQAHYNIFSPATDEIRCAFDLYASLGVKIQVTELDVSLFRHDDKSQLPQDESELARLLDHQAEYYAALFRVFKEYAGTLDSVTFWGVCDEDSWLNNFPAPRRRNMPLLFDARGAKPCYDAIMGV